MNIETSLFYFFVYAFLGWICETVHETIKRRTFVNAGFLHGPFVPVYGVAVVCMLSMDGFLDQWIPLPVRVLIYTLLASALEYYTGMLLEEVFGIRMWDYSDHFCNLHGRICLQYSLYWLGLSGMLLVVLNPGISHLTSEIAPRWLHAVNRILGVYMLIDLLWSIRSLNTFKDAMGTLHSRYLSITGGAYEKMLESVARLTTGFPYLRRYLTVTAGENILDTFRLNIPGLKIKGLPKLQPDEQPEAVSPEIDGQTDQLVDPAWIETVRDILDNGEFCKLKSFRHHTGTIFDHAVAVSHLAWKICKRNGWDAHSTARGALLHDFFLYDWRDCIQENGEKTKGLHAFTHARMALDNAAKRFSLNSLEKDVIAKHMWPVTFPLPRYRESLLVTFLDKYVATREMLTGRAMKERLPDEYNPCPSCKFQCGKRA